MRIDGLVLAAGYGTRSLQSMGVEKQRVRVSGMPLLCYPLAALVSAGLSRIYVATASHAYGFVEQAIRECGVSAGVILVPEPWRGNGYTLLYSLAEIARLGASEWVIVAMSDHIVHPYMVRMLMGSLGRLESYDYIILADRRPGFVDYVEATKMSVEDERIIRVGKKINNADAVDTGVHAVRPSLARILDEEFQIEIIDMVNMLAESRKAGAVLGVDGAPWIDVDGFDDLYNVECGPGRSAVERVIDDVIAPKSIFMLKGVLCDG